MNDSMLWVVGTGAIAAVFGFAAVVLWLLERVSSVPAERRRGEEIRASATDAAIIFGGVLVGASSALEPGSARYLVPLALALIAMGAVPHQRSERQRQSMRILALLLFTAVHVMFSLNRG